LTEGKRGAGCSASGDSILVIIVKAWLQAALRLEWCMNMSHQAAPLGGNMSDGSGALTL
jgi:hypothetical protein